MSSNAIVLSIRPHYVDMIFNRTKTVELRRSRPKRVVQGSLVLVYASSPIRSLVGAFKIAKIVEKPLGELWELVKDTAGVTKEEYLEYFQGLDSGVGIFLDDVWLLDAPINLDDWAEQGISFHPPQSFRYATDDELATPQIAELVDGYQASIQYRLL
ncbi:MAG: ASCH domain-containing protein [Caldilineaceae bacterium]|nr:ASCH domain-containing protein [Caldilineaceae bacterium]